MLNAYTTSATRVCHAEAHCIAEAVWVWLWDTLPLCVCVCVFLQDRESSAALTVFWAGWWPLVLLSFPFLGRAWCAMW